MVLKQLDIHMQKNGSRYTLIPFTKLTQKWIADRPKCKIQKYKSPRKNIGENLYDLVYGDIFLDSTPKT